MLMYMAYKVRVVSSRVSGEFYEALTRSAEEYGQTVSEFTKAALQAAITAPMNEGRTLLRGASMVCALGEAAVLLRRVVREAVAAGERVTKVSAGLTGALPDDWDPKDGPPQSTLPFALRGEGKGPTKDNPIVTRSVPDPDPDSD